MPTYQYVCTECGHAFEQVQSFSDDALTVCPACSGRLRKFFNAVGVVFKGSGFYRTDSRSGAKSDSDGDSSSSDRKAETKSADKKEPAGVSAMSDGSGNGKQPASGGASSTGQKSAAN